MKLIQKEVILPIHSIWFWLTAEGKKKVELRKKLWNPKKYDIKKIWYYVSGKGYQRIMGFISKNNFTLHSNIEINEIWEKTKYHSMVKKEFFEKYYSKSSKGSYLFINSFESIYPFSPKVEIENWIGTPNYSFIEVGLFDKYVSKSFNPKNCLLDCETKIGVICLGWPCPILNLNRG